VLDGGLKPTPLGILVINSREKYLNISGNNMSVINLVREIRELKTQLSYSKNIGFFFGAGSSCALGIPNVVQLTNEIGSLLGNDELTTFHLLLEELKTTVVNRDVNIEDVLNHLRRIRELTNEQKTKEYQGVNGESAKNTDIQICKKIYKVIMEKEEVANLESPKKFFAWLSLLNREFSKEIFTTNYDLIIEKSLEANSLFRRFRWFLRTILFTIKH